MSATYFVLSGTEHLGATDKPNGGRVLITATVPEIKDTVGKILFSGTWPAPLDDQGKWSVALVHPTSTDIVPTHFGYTAVRQLDDGDRPAVTFPVPDGITALDWTEIVSVDPPDPIYGGAGGFIDGGGPGTP